MLSYAKYLFPLSNNFYKLSFTWQEGKVLNNIFSCEEINYQSQLVSSFITTW